MRYKFLEIEKAAGTLSAVLLGSSYAKGCVKRDCFYAVFETEVPA